MNKNLSVIFLIAMLILTTTAGAQTQTNAGNSAAATIDPAIEVRECLNTVKRNISGWCGTPEIMAEEQIKELGKAAVPYLIEGLKSSEFADIHKFIIRVLPDVCFCEFKGTSREAVITQAEEWWSINRNQREQDLILDALESGDMSRVPYAYERAKILTSKKDMTRLTSFLTSKNDTVVWDGLSILWTNFKSEKALEYARNACLNGTKDHRQIAVSFCRENKIKSLGPAIAKMLQKENDSKIIREALMAAEEMSLCECIPAIEKMDSAPSSKYPKNYVIHTLAMLKTTHYGERVLYYLNAGDTGERMAAAEVICNCVPAEDSIAPLIAALEDPEWNVRRYACISLGRATSDRSLKSRVCEVIPILLQQLRGEDKFDLSLEAHRALKMICSAHFGQDKLPKVDESLGGQRFRENALPLWEEWWSRGGE